MSAGLRPKNVHTRYHAVNLYDFQGLDTTRSSIALDTGKKQHLSRCNNAYCDDGGQIIREPSYFHLKGDGWVSHLKFFNRSTFTWAEQRGSGVALVSSRDHEIADVYASGSVVSSIVFGGHVFYASYGQPTYYYDGSIWREMMGTTLASSGAAFLTAARRRMIYAGMPGAPTKLFLSRVDSPEVGPDDEDPNSTDELRGMFIDIANEINTGDVITGVGVFETDRAVVFTSSRPLIYQIDPEVQRVRLVDQVAANVGTVSHNSIVNAGRDLLFCSKGGVNSIRRSQFQSVSVYSVPMSERVNMLYRALVAGTQNTQAISASWDQDTGRYHIFFPDSSGTRYTRLSLLVRETNDGVTQKWSTATLLNATCGDELGGRYLMGSRQGVFESLDVGQSSDVSVPVEMDVLTPVLWDKSMHTKKIGHSYSLMMDGVGEVEVGFYDEGNRLLKVDRFNLSEDEPGDTLPYEPLVRQYQRPLDVQFIGLQVRVQTTGRGLVRLAGISINIRD